MLERENSNNIFGMMYGSLRRKYILSNISSYSKNGYIGLPVNNKWQWSTNDQDIKILLKKNLVKQIRTGGKAGFNGFKHAGKRQTYLVLVD